MKGKEVELSLTLANILAMKQGDEEEPPVPDHVLIAAGAKAMGHSEKTAKLLAESGRLSEDTEPLEPSLAQGLLNTYKEQGKRVMKRNKLQSRVGNVYNIHEPPATLNEAVFRTNEAWEYVFRVHASCEAWAAATQQAKEVLATTLRGESKWQEVLECAKKRLCCELEHQQGYLVRMRNDATHATQTDNEAHKDNAMGLIKEINEGLPRVSQCIKRAQNPANQTPRDAIM